MAGGFPLSLREKDQHRFSRGRGRTARPLWWCSFAPVTELLSTCSRCARFVIVAHVPTCYSYWSLASQIIRHVVRRLTTPLLLADHIKPTYSCFTLSIISCDFSQNTLCEFLAPKFRNIPFVLLRVGTIDSGIIFLLKEFK